MKGIPMTSSVLDGKLGIRRMGACLLSALLLVTAASAKSPIVPKWGRFEQTFKSGVRYSNPPQECELRVTFTSPHGETNTVLGFWDGRKNWHVRFSPDFTGHWTYRTECSDYANARL